MSEGASVLVAGATGGCGATLLAAGIALAWARSGVRATLVELDLGRGDLGGAWDVPAERTLADLEPVAAELAPPHVEQVAHHHPGGLRLVLAPAVPGPGEAWRGPAAGRLVDAVAGLGPWVGDGGTGAGPLAAAAAVRARARLVVAPATVAGARRARRLAEALGGGPGRPLRLVVAGAGAPGDVGHRGLARACGLELAGALPRDPAGAADIGAGRWPARRRGLGREIARLAEALA